VRGYDELILENKRLSHVKKVLLVFEYVYLPLDSFKSGTWTGVRRKLLL
jgi:hypothetical protein